MLKKDMADMDRLAEKEAADPSTNYSIKAASLKNLEGGRLTGFFDTSAGFTVAGKACAWARYLAEKEGVKFVLGPETGKLDELLVQDEGENKRVVGLKTVDGVKHGTDVVVVACAFSISSFFLLLSHINELKLKFHCRWWMDSQCCA